MLQRTAVGKRVVLKAGAVIGGDGFGYLSGGWRHIAGFPHVGRCIMEDDVEIGANTTVDRGSVDDTVIGRGPRSTTWSRWATTCASARAVCIMAGVGHRGKHAVGDDVILAGQVGVSDHLTIGAGARVAAKSGVFGDVDAGRDVSAAIPARPHREFLRAQAALYRLAPIVAELGARSCRRRATPRWLGAPSRGDAAVSGTGLHTGRETGATVLPAPAGAGHRVPPGRPARRARDSRPALRSATSVERRTAIGRGRRTVQTVEHLLAAVAALEIDDLTIELDGPEPPIGDGSFAPYFEALQEAGPVERPGEPGGLPVHGAVHRDRGRCVLRRGARQRRSGSP